MVVVGLLVLFVAIFQSGQFVRPNTGSNTVIPTVTLESATP
jgi:hypothetical protein